ncbi:hypothetical protein ACFE04_022618 [Oxalis oulophora]
MSIPATIHRHRHRHTLLLRRFLHYKPPKTPPPPAPPSPPNPPKKPQTFTHQSSTWHDPYSWMSSLNDRVAMRHMDIYMEQEEKYLEAVIMNTDRLQSKLQSEMGSRLQYDLSTPPLMWGPWLYYRRVEEGKPYPVLCRRLVKLNDEFVSNKSPFTGFDFTSGKKIEQKLIDYNHEAERHGGYAYEELSEVSPDHQFIAYTMYDKENDYFKLSVRNLNSGALCSKPKAEQVSNIAWAKDGQALLYVVTNQNKRPYRLYCSVIGSTDEDVLLHEELDEDVHVNIRHTKDFQFVTVNTFSPSSSKVFLINAAHPLSGLTLVWECECIAHCIIEHHQGFLYLFTDAAKQGQVVDHHYLLRCPVGASSSTWNWEDVFIDEQDIVIEDVDFSNTHLVLIVRENQKYRLCSVPLPLPWGKMPDAVVDFDLTNGNVQIIQQQNMLHERTKVLYGTVPLASFAENLKNNDGSVSKNDDNPWNELSEIYACEHYDVPSHDGVMVPLTVIYSRKTKKEFQNPGLLHGHGAYGELIDKRWRSELKSLLDRGWVIAYADVRGGGGRGKKWHHDGRSTMKHNSINDFVSSAKFLVEKGLVQENKLAGWGYSAGGLLVASAINHSPHLFRAAVLKVPFLDPTSTLLHPIVPLTAADYEEFGYPGVVDEFHAIRQYSPYDNIQEGVIYPAILVTSSFNTRFGVWEAAKWVARARERVVYDPKRPILLNLTTDIVEENRYLHCKESALETAFLITMMDS